MQNVKEQTTSNYFFELLFFVARFFVAFLALFFADDFFVAFLADFFADFFLGTFAPFSLASESPIAIACFRLLTFPPLPLFNVPFFLRRIADLTVSCDFFEYFAIGFFILNAL
jgi:hypothetical protein